MIVQQNIGRTLIDADTGQIVEIRNGGTKIVGVSNTQMTIDAADNFSMLQLTAPGGTNGDSGISFQSNRGQIGFVDGHLRLRTSDTGKDIRFIVDTNGANKEVVRMDAADNVTRFFHTAANSNGVVGNLNGTSWYGLMNTNVFTPNINSVDYALIQNNVGATFINASANQQIQHRIGNVAQETWGSPVQVYVPRVYHMDDQSQNIGSDDANDTVIEMDAEDINRGVIFERNLTTAGNRYPILFQAPSGNFTEGFRYVDNELQIVAGNDADPDNLTVDITFGAGKVEFFGEYTFPTTDGTDGQVLTTDGAGAVTFTNTIKGCVFNGKLTTVQIAALTPSACDTAYDIDLNKHQGYDGTTWNSFY